MKKFEVDTPHFKGITIWFDYLEEGLDYAQKHNIKEVLVRTDGDWGKKTVNFDFLKNRDFIETFHWIVSLSKKSDTVGLAYLSKLKDLRWGGAGDFSLDLSSFPLLKELNIGYGPKITGWETMKSLNFLLAAGVTTEDLSFLQYATNLEYLRLIAGKFVSIRGIENCSKLQRLFIQTCRSLTELNSTLKKLTKLEDFTLEGCKKVNIEEELSGIDIKYVTIL